MIQPRTSPNLQFWNAIGLGLFVVLAALALWLIDRFGSEISLEFFDLVIIVLATFRLAHLFTNDKIFDFVRALLFVGRGARLTKAERGWRRAAGELIDCLWCAGLWSALIVVTIYFLGTWGFFTDIVLAVAGAAALLQLLGRAISART